MKLKAHTHSGDQEMLELDHAPDECPLCHLRISPRAVTAIIKEPTFENEAQVVFQCTSAKCQGLFIGYYRIPLGHSDYGRQSHELRRTAPIVVPEPPLPAEVKTLSPRFVEVYAQALAAGLHRLDQLVGMGLRKALEILVKDLAAKLHPDKVEAIRSMPLAGCIKTFLPDPNLQDCATRATWLGNDETHYERRWQEQDISDLLTLVKLTINWTESTLLTQKYREEMK